MSASGPGAKAGFPRLLGSLFYDSLLTFSLLFALEGVLVTLNDGEALSSDEYWHFPLLLGACFSYFGWCWTHSGQTLGMRAWRIRVVHSTKITPLSWKGALMRFGASLLSWIPAGLGFFWVIFDKEGRSWHDRLSGSHLIRLS